MPIVNSYNDDNTPSLSDKLFATDSETGKSVNIPISTVVQLVNEAAGVEAILYEFASTYSERGGFSTNGNVDNPTGITHILLNKESLFGGDLSLLYNRLSEFDDVVIQLINPGNANNFFNFKIINITDNTSFFDLEVEVHEGFYYGVLLPKNVYSLKFDIKETPTLKLDKGNYVGTAETLKTDIETRVVKVTESSLVTDAEIIKLSHLDDTTDLQKPVSTAQQAAIDAAVQANLVDSTLINGVTTSSAIPPTGNIHAIGVGAGTYTNWGGMVVPANNIGTLSRVGGVYAVSLTAFTDINKILPWTAQSYLINAQVNHLGIDWVANAATVAGDVPGTSNKWVERNTKNEKLKLEKLGLINRDAFFISAAAYKIANAILKLNIEVDDSLAAAADIRLYAVFNRSANPTDCLIFKNYTTGTIISLTKTSGVNTGVLSLSKSSSDGLIKITATVNLDEIPYTDSFSFYQDNTTSSAKFSFTKFSEANVKNIDLTTLNANVDELVAQSLGYDNTLVYVNEAVNGWYNKDTGAFSASAGHRSRKYTIGANRNIYATGTVAGIPIALAYYYTSGGTFISSEFTHPNNDQRTYTRQKLNVPPTCGIIGISTVSSFAYGVMEQGIIDIVTSDDLALANSTKKDSSMVWFGTSIPASGYPALIASKLGCTIYNEALGSSPIRAFSSVTGTQKGLYYTVALNSLSHTVAEKQSMIDHWTTGLDVDGNVIGGGTYGWRDLLLGSPPAALSSYASDATILSYSYEKKLVAKYLDSTSPDFVGMPDYFILDHGHNDLVVSSYDVDDNAAINIPAIRNNRAYFNGAMNYIIDIILSYNPRAKILLIGHYENDRKTRIYQAQQKCADYWDFPFLKLWEKMGFSQQIVPTTGYWSDSYTWIPTGGTLTNKTMTQIWMQDDLHPQSDATKQKFADVIYNFINNN